MYYVKKVVLITMYIETCPDPPVQVTTPAVTEAASTGKLLQCSYNTPSLSLDRHSSVLVAKCSWQV